MVMSSNTMALLWKDVLSAVINKGQNPGYFNRFYIGRLELPNPPVHTHKFLKRTGIVRREDQFRLSSPLQGITLTPREIQVLYLICAGHTNKEAADFMNLSPRTSEYYIKNMRKKIGASSKLHLIELIKQTDFLNRVDESILKT